MAETSDDAARLVARARERFLEAGDVPSIPVAAGVVESWRRSRLFGVACDRIDPPYFGDLDTGSRLVHAASPVLERLAETLSDAAMSFLLTDAQGRVLRRRSADRSLIRHLDDIRLAPGFSYAEEDVGTNGIGTAIETRRACCVSGSEHFTDVLHTMACAGVPIRDRLTGRPVGLLDVTCWRKDAGPLMAALVTTAAGDIEQRLLELGSERERAMLTEFLAFRTHGGRAILTVSDNLTMANDRATDLLEAADYAIVRDKVAEPLQSGRELTSQVMLSRGEPAIMRCRPIGIHGGTAGAVVEITMVEEPPGASRALIPPAELNLAGSSMAFSKVCTDLETQCRARTGALVEGEPGVGKLALAEAVHRRCTPDGSLTVIEPWEVAQDLTVCLTRMASALGSPGCTVVLRHPERFAPGALEAVVECMDSVSGPQGRPWMVATTARGTELTDDLLRRLPVTLTVPALRHRIDDVRELVPALLHRFAPRDSVSCGPTAMRVLLRSTWPGNVGELVHTVRHALTRRRAGQIQPADLPRSCHVRSRRVLTPWESHERDTIVGALLETSGDKVAAAGLLGISRATIYRKINVYGISVDPR